MYKLNKELLKINIDKAAQYDFDNQKVFGSALYRKMLSFTSNATESHPLIRKILLQKTQYSAWLP